MLKASIVNELGESQLLLPAYIEQALEANNQVKYLFTLLQEARHFSDHPENGPADLRTERIVAGITDSRFDAIIPNSQSTTEGKYYIPHISEIHEQIISALNKMLSPVRIGLKENEFKEFEQRLKNLQALTPDFIGDEVNSDYIIMATHGLHNSTDSMHLLVMDLHKLINKLQSELAQENLDGAKAYSINNNDRILIKAFMSGLNSTSPLKFDHPGLDTTATHSKDKLIIENDIGTTNAHVLVIHVEGMKATLTYTDVHEQRLVFFERLFESYNVDWQDTLSRELGEESKEDRYFLCVGSFVAESEEQLCKYLQFLGSRLVFLIDWNKARKRLRNFVKKQDCLTILKWAADNNFGHRGFLQAGGERIIYEALAQISRAESHYGDRLDELLNRENAIEFLKFVLQTAATGLLNGRSERLIRDEIKAEIFNCFQSADESIYEICADHAAIIFDLADAVNNCLIQKNDSLQKEHISRMAVLAKRWETKADNLLNRVREVAQRTGDGIQIRKLTEEADDVADSLEEIAYLLTLLPDRSIATNVSQPLQSLSNLLVEGARGYVRCIETAKQLEESNVREDRQDFLETVDDVITIEHQTDSEERRLLKVLLQEDSNEKQMHLLTRLGQTFEEAADSLSRCVLIMKDYIIDEVITP
jgi:uncharacterized protein Yka (UPF0111/DUF47 family)